MRQSLVFYRRAWGTLLYLAVFVLAVQLSQAMTKPPKTEPRINRQLVQMHLAAQKRDASDKVPMLVPDYHLPPITNGLAPVVSYVPTKQPVVFLTIDDGVTKNPAALQLLSQYHVPATMFLNQVYVQEDPGYFKSIVALGGAVEDHTIDHPDLTTLNPAQQQAEICNDADDFASELGVPRPTLFRPPYGAYNNSVLSSAAACGMRAVVMWSADANGGVMSYQDGRTSLVPGDIVIMHFRPEFAQDFQAFITAAQQAHLQPQLLADWLQP